MHDLVKHGPPDNSALRSTLYLIDLAADQSDTETVRHVANLALSSEETEVDTDLDTILIALMNFTPEDDYYRVYRKEDVDTARMRLDRIAYGNFYEAIDYLTSDIQRYGKPKSLKSDVFRPELFEVDKEDIDLWNRMRSLTKEQADSDYSPASDKLQEKAIKEIRLHMQKYYGKLIPVVTTSYTNQTEEGSSGHSAKFWYQDSSLETRTGAPFHEKLRNHLLRSQPFTTSEDFDPNSLPEDIDGNILSSINVGSLFQYELIGD